MANHFLGTMERKRESFCCVISHFSMLFFLMGNRGNKINMGKHKAGLNKTFESSWKQLGNNRYNWLKNFFSYWNCLHCSSVIFQKYWKKMFDLYLLRFKGFFFQNFETKIYIYQDIRFMFTWNFLFPIHVRPIRLHNAKWNVDSIYKNPMPCTWTKTVKHNLICQDKNKNFLLLNNS